MKIAVTEKSAKNKNAKVFVIMPAEQMPFVKSKIINLIASAPKVTLEIHSKYVCILTKQQKVELVSLNSYLNPNP